MKFLKETISNEIVINKSRFIAVLTAISSFDNISSVIANIKKAYPKATHYCYACLAGTNAEYQNSNDDNEPSGTAGIPILNVLKHHNVTNVLCVVIRYFGGIKLGAGGLIRAYGNAAGEVLKLASFYEIKKVPSYLLMFSYDKINTIEYLIKDAGTILNKEYSDQVSYTIYLEDISILDELKYQTSNAEYLGEIEIKVISD